MSGSERRIDERACMLDARVIGDPVRYRRRRHHRLRT